MKVGLKFASIIVLLLLFDISYLSAQSDKLIITLKNKEKSIVELKNIDSIFVGKNLSTINYEIQKLNNYPNPASRFTILEIISNSTNYVSISIHNLSGITVFSNDIFLVDKGLNSFVWNLKDNFGNSVVDGIYYLRLIIKNQLYIHKIVVLNKD